MQYVLVILLGLVLGVHGNVSNSSTRFIVLGDWGGLPIFPYRTPIEDAVSLQMARYASQTNSEFILALGDNFYFDGVKSIEDPRFQMTYNKVFNATSLDVEWYFVAGNHDHNGNVSAQIAYTNLEKRWIFPDFYYNLQFPVGNTSATIEILMIDTVILCGNSDHDFKHKQPQGPENGNDADKQWAWIEERLKSSKADYLIVAGHFPVFSVAEHGPTEILVQRLLPLLYKYNVTAYFCGHDHNMQHLQYTQNGHTVDYFLSGAANFIDDSTTHMNSVPENSLKYHWANILSLGAFGYVEATKDSMMYSFIEANGKMLYRSKMYPRKF